MRETKLMEFEVLLADRQAHSDALDAAWEYRSKKRRTRREASERHKRMAKAIAVGIALAIPTAAVLAAPATGAAESTEPMDKLQRPALAEIPEEAENERIEAALLARAHVIENCKVTYYDCCKKCCGKVDSITASGVQAVPYVTCAVDTAIIPFGADVLVDYGDGRMHYYKADDTGVTGGHIDICVGSHTEALQLGVNRATVYWVAE